MFEGLVDLVTLKAPNYGAKIGQAINGALGRGQGGRFTRVGSSDPKLNGILSRAGGAPSKAKKGKGSAKGSKKLNDSQQDAAAEKSGLPTAEASALRQFASGGQLSPDAVASLQKRGLVDVGSDGKPRLGPNARGVIAAMKRGDQRGIEDALSKANDSQRREEDRNSKSAQKKAEAEAKKASAGAKSAERKAAADKRRQEVEARRQAGAKAKAKVKLTQYNNELNNYDQTIQDITAADSWADNEDTRTNIGQKLEVLSAKIDATAGLDDTTRETLKKRIDDQMKAINWDSEPTTKSLTVFKQDDGTYRWIVESSNAFRDREDEIVSQAALEADIARMNETKEYGPLRWWHVGLPTFKEALKWDTASAGNGVDIGDCDFAAMVGRICVESGTFKSKAIAEAVAANADQLQVSRGFSHPLGHPVNGVYEQIRGIERSLLPTGRAANPFTSVLVTKEFIDMNVKEKIAAFKTLFGGNEAAAKGLLTQLAEKDADLAKVIAFKEDGGGDAAPVEAKAEGDPAPEDAGDGGDGTTFVGDMTPDEFMGMLSGALAKALEPLVGAVGKSMEQVGNAALTAQEAAGVVEKQMQAAKEAKDQEVADLKKRLAELEGDSPKGKGFVASVDDGSVTIPGIVVKQLTQAMQQPTQGNPLVDFFATGKVPAQA